MKQTINSLSLCHLETINSLFRFLKNVSLTFFNSMTAFSCWYLPCVLVPLLIDFLSFLTPSASTRFPYASLSVDFLLSWRISFPRKFPSLQSPRAHLHVVGMLRFMSMTKTNRACPLLFILFLCLFLSLWPASTVFHSINSLDNCPFSHSVLPVLYLPYWSFQLYVSLWSLFQPWYNP